MTISTATQARTVVGGSGGDSKIQLQGELEDLEGQREKLQKERQECCADKDDRVSVRSVNLDVEMSQIEDQIQTIQEELSEDGEQIREDDGTIQINSVVTVLTDAGSECRFTIRPKGKPAKDCITANSVMGRALIGTRVGDEVTAHPPKGPVIWTVLVVS